jgi:hypothetical protein
MSSSHSGAGGGGCVNGLTSLTWKPLKWAMISSRPQRGVEPRRKPSSNPLDDLTVSRQLGHASPDITLRVYAHLFDHAAHAEQAREALEAGFGRMLEGCTQLDASFPLAISAFCVLEGIEEAVRELRHGSEHAATESPEVPLIAVGELVPGEQRSIQVKRVGDLVGRHASAYSRCSAAIGGGLA